MGECIIARRGGSSKVGTVSIARSVGRNTQYCAPSDFTGGNILRPGDLLFAQPLVNTIPVQVYGYYQDANHGNVIVLIAVGNVSADITFDVYRTD